MVAGMWVAGTRTGCILQDFYLVDATGGGTYFVETRCLSISFGHDPIAGKTVVMWIEGINYSNSPGTILHYVASDSDQGTLSSVEYVAFQLFTPHNLNKPILSRVGVALNLSLFSILNSCDNDDPSLGGSGSDKGVVSRSGAASFGITNRFTIADVEFWASSTAATKYLQKFLWVETAVGGYNVFRGDRLEDFQCVNDGFLGRSATLWMEGRFGNDPVNGNGAVRKARVVFNDSASSIFGLEFLYIAVYHPLNLSTPHYERIVFFPAGTGNNQILCK